MADADQTDNLKRSVEALEGRLDLIERQIERVATVLTEVRQLVGPFGTLLGNGRLLVQTLHGLKYLVDPDDLIMTPQLIVYRQWEPELSALVSRLLNAESVFVDVGANFGYFTCLAGSRIGPFGHGRVIAVEPNPAMMALLEANVAINWSLSPMEMHPCAIGPQPGRAALLIPTSKAANATLSPDQGNAGDHRILQVEVKPLDLVVPPGLAVDLLKIDVEGHETGVLRGAGRILSESPHIVIVIEWSKRQMSEAGYEPGELIDLIASFGLVAYEISPDGATTTLMPPEKLMATDYTNIALRRPVTA